jgi:hypothetical protein
MTTRIRIAVLLPAGFAIGVAGPAVAGDPPPSAAPTAPAPAAPPKACAVGQRCGDRCIAWTEVCEPALAAMVGLAPPAVEGAPTPEGAAPAGSALLTLPTMRPSHGPSFRPEAPDYCTTGTGTDNVPAECMAYYQIGSTGGMLVPAPAAPDCLHHMRCAGVCLQEGEVCPAFAVDPARRLDAFDQPLPAPTSR